MLTIKKEMSLNEYEPWSGAVDTFNRIVDEGKLDTLECVLEDLYPEGIDETSLNDLLWFESETVFEWLDIKDDEDEEDEDEDEDEDKKEKAMQEVKDAVDFDAFCNNHGFCINCPFYYGPGIDCEGEDRFKELKQAV